MHYFREKILKIWKKVEIGREKKNVTPYQASYLRFHIRAADGSSNSPLATKASNLESFSFF